MTQKKFEKLRCWIRFHSASKISNYYEGSGGRRKKKENSTELQKPNVEVEVYDDNKNVTEEKEQKSSKA